MLQRNATDHPLTVWAASATVEPGDTIDYPHPIAGFEPAEPEPSPPKTTNRKSAAKTADSEGATA